MKNIFSSLFGKKTKGKETLLEREMFEIKRDESINAERNFCDAEKLQNIPQMEVWAEVYRRSLYKEIVTRINKIKHGYNCPKKEKEERINCLWNEYLMNADRLKNRIPTVDIDEDVVCERIENTTPREKIREELKICMKKSREIFTRIISIPQQLED